MAETIIGVIGVIVILLIFIVGISVSQINGNIKRLVKIQTELLEHTSNVRSSGHEIAAVRPIARTGDRFDPMTGKPL